MKHIKLRSLLIATLVMQVFCCMAHADKKVKTGWAPYVGAGIGYGVVNMRNKYYDLTSSGDSTSSNSDLVAKGSVESLFAGIQKQINRIALGAELYGYLSQQKANFNTSTLLSSGDMMSESKAAQRKYGYGVKLKAGYLVNLTSLVYLHVGLENARFQWSGVLGGGAGTYKKTKMLVGIPLGAGFELDISSIWKVRLEYVYTPYKTWNTGILSATNIIKSKINPCQHAAILGFSYKI